MATSKKTSTAASKSSQAGKAAVGKAASLATSIKSGSMPPYGEAIGQASARGEIQEMKMVAAAARQWLKDVQAALAKLDQSLQKSPK